MKMIEYNDDQAGYGKGPRLLVRAMRETIWDWRNGSCPFGRLDDGEDVPAGVVERYARKLHDSIGEDSLFLKKRPALKMVADYAEKVKLCEQARAALKKAAAAYFKAGIPYSYFYHEAVSVGSEEIANKEDTR